jgi:hypothetical protein
VVRAETRDPVVYADTWIRHSEGDDAEDFAERLDEWLAYYRRLGIEALSAGMLTLRKRSSGNNYFRYDDGPPSMLGPAGDDVEQRFAAYDFLERAADPRQLLASVFEVSPQTRLTHECAAQREGWRVIRTSLAKAAGFAYSAEADPLVAAIIGGCDGQQTLSEVMTAVSESHELPLQELAATIGPALRGLIERGYLRVVREEFRAS